MSDVRTTLRGLFRSPLIAVAAVATIAVAVGGTAAVFALLDSVVLRSLPYRDADRLVAVWVDMTELAGEIGVQDPRREWTGLDNHRDLRAMSRTLDDVAVFSGWTPSFRADDGMQRIDAAAISWNGLHVLGVTPVAGRLFAESEGEPGSEFCAVAVSERFARRHFATADIVGRDIVFTGETCTVVGVLPASFRFPFLPTADVFSPIRNAGADRGSAFLRQYGRLADGVTLEQAQAELDTIAAALRAEYPSENRGQGLFVEPLQEALNGGVRAQLLLLQAAAVLVLVVAVANLASLMVARALARSGEFGVRAALGAGRGRQFRLLWTECALLAGVGAAFGVGLAVAGVRLLTRAFPAGFNDTWAVSIGASTVGVAGAAALVAALVMATVSYGALARAVRPAASGGTRVAGSRSGRRLSAALIATNFAIALAVAVAGLLMLQSFQRLAAVDPGYRTDGVVAGLIALPSAQYSRNYIDSAALVAGYQRLVTELEAIPGVDAVGLASSLPLGQSNTDTFVSVEGRPTTRRDDGRAHVWLTRANEGYFDAMGIRVRDGRGFTDADRVNGRDVAVVNEAFVRAYLGGDPATGVRIATGPDDQPRWWDIVGVADDVRFFDLAQPESPALYLPTWAAPSRSIYTVVRSGRDALSVMQDLRRAIAAFDPELALTDLRATGERVNAELMMPRAVSRLTLLFAAIALALAAIGVYGTLAQAVVRRTREFGVRRALGAQDRDVVLQVLRQGLVPVVAGLVVGAPLALLLGRRIETVLFAVTPSDPRAWLFAFAALLGVAVVASLLPGRRALRVPPMQALREE